MVRSWRVLRRWRQACALAGAVAGLIVLSTVPVAAQEPGDQAALPSAEVVGGFEAKLFWEDPAPEDSVILELEISPSGTVPPQGHQAAAELLTCMGEPIAPAHSRTYTHEYSRFQMTDLDVWVNWREYCSGELDIGELVPFRLEIYQLPGFGEASTSTPVLTVDGNYPVAYRPDPKGSLGAELLVAYVKVTPGAAASPAGGDDTARNVLIGIAATAAVLLGVGEAWRRQRRRRSERDRLNWRLEREWEECRRRLTEAEGRQSTRLARIEYLRGRIRGIDQALDFSRRQVAWLEGSFAWRTWAWTAAKIGVVISTAMVGLAKAAGRWTAGWLWGLRAAGGAGSVSGSYLGDDQLNGYRDAIIKIRAMQESVLVLRSRLDAELTLLLQEQSEAVDEIQRLGGECQAMAERLARLRGATGPVGPMRR